MSAPYEQAPPPPMSDPPMSQQPPRIWRPLENRLLAVKITFWIIAGVWLVAVGSDILEILLANRVIGGESVGASELSASDNRQLLVGWVQRAAWIGGVVAFIMWLYRAYQNVDAVSPGHRNHGHGWAIGGWFVPILAAWRPKQIVNDITRAGGRDPGWLLLSWWALWLIYNFMSNVARRSYNAADTPESWRSASIEYLVTDALGVVTAILAIFVAATLTRQLNERAAPTGMRHTLQPAARRSDTSLSPRWANNRSTREEPDDGHKQSVPAG